MTPHSHDATGTGSPATRCGTPEMPHVPPPRFDDATLRRAAEAALRELFPIDMWFVFVEVEDGVVRIRGVCRTERTWRALRRLTAGLPGAQRVEVALAPPPGAFDA